MNRKILVSILLFFVLPISFLSCGDDDEEDIPQKIADSQFTVTNGSSQQKYMAVVANVKNESAYSKITLSTTDVKGNSDYGSYTGGELVITHTLQGSGVYDIVSPNGVVSASQTREKLLSLNMELGTGTSSEYIYYSMTYSENSVAYVEEKNGKYYITINEPVRLSFGGGHYNPSLSEPNSHVEVVISMNR